MLTATKTKTVYDQLFEQSQAIVEAYRTDFEYDKRLISKNDGVPFIHIAYETGTYLDFLSPFESYSAPCEKNPYLFGRADRWGLLERKVSHVKYCIENPRPNVCHYFDGKKLKKIKIDEALQLVKKYQQKMSQMFKDN